jgi:hypothetical protein
VQQSDDDSASNGRSLTQRSKRPTVAPEAMAQKE